MAVVVVMRLVMAVIVVMGAQGIMPVSVPMLVPMRVVMSVHVHMLVAMPVFVVMLVRMLIIVPLLIVRMLIIVTLLIVLMRVILHMRVIVRMPMRVIMYMHMTASSCRINYDDAIAVGTAARGTHSSTSNSLTRSSPPATHSRMPPQAHRPTGCSRGTSTAHEVHRARPATSRISRAAPSARVPRLTTSKQNLTASGMTAESRPISTVTRNTFAPRAFSTAIATMFRVMLSSCTLVSSADPR
jgi:hypothetical protein